jgi:hypothetical protein
MSLRMMLAPVLVATLDFAGCAWNGDYRGNAGPSLVREGVEVRVVGQECYLNRSADEVVRIDDDMLDIKVKLLLKNDTDAKLTIYPEAITLRDSKVDAGPTWQSHPASSFDLAPGQSKHFDVFFTRGGELDCSSELSLHLGRSVTVRGSPITLPVLNLAER